MSTSYVIFGYLGGVVILLMFFWIFFALHMAYTQMDELLDGLKNCSAIMRHAPLRHRGLWGRLWLMGEISGSVTFPGFYLKRGELSLDDLNHLPAPLKRKLVLIQWNLIGLIGLAVVLWVIGKLVGWHK